jgi:hypothetical protein
MKTKSRITQFGLGLIVLLPSAVHAAKATPDLLPPQRRQATVTTAEQLAQPKVPPPLPADLVSPFNPTYFDRKETPEEAPANPDSRGTPATPARLGDRQILELLAAQLPSTGTMHIGGSPRLTMGSKRFEVGTRFTVTYNNEDYELELVSIDRTTFTLRYRGEEITRPIKPVK